MIVIKCENCIHDSVCHIQEVCNDIDEQINNFGCEDFIDKSLIIELPCRVGDVVYMINALGKREECTVEEICTNPFNNVAVLRRTKGVRNRIGTYFKDFGKTVFLSREEAERALEESL